jgi:hypothetical protein
MTDLGRPAARHAGPARPAVTCPARSAS